MSSLDKFPAVTIYPKPRPRKREHLWYVVVLLRDDTGAEKTILWANDWGSHPNVVTHIKSHLHETNISIVRVCSGGDMIFDPKEKLIEIYNRSGTYGEDDKEVSAEMLRCRFSKYEVYI